MFKANKLTKSNCYFTDAATRRGCHFDRDKIDTEECLACCNLCDNLECPSRCVMTQYDKMHFTLYVEDRITGEKGWELGAYEDQGTLRLTLGDIVLYDGERRFNCATR